MDEGDPPRSVVAARVECATGDEQRLAQVVGRRGGIAIRPQGLDRLLAMQAVLRCEGQELDHCPRLAQPPGLFAHHDVARGDAKAAEEIDVQLRSW